VAVDPQLRRQITRAVLLVAGIAAVIGLVVALTATAALRMAGVTGDDGPAPTAAAPEPDEPNEPETREPSPSASPSPSPTGEPTAGPTSRSPKPERREQQAAITLRASTLSAGSMQEVTLSGRYPGGNGTTLQVQRREGGSWVPFPTSAQVDGGSFSTYVALGQPGPNRMRVVDTGSGTSSNVVTINIS